MCRMCLDNQDKREREAKMYAIPVQYAEREVQGNEHSIPVIVSRRLSRPRRCTSHCVKVAKRILNRVFGNA